MKYTFKLFQIVLLICGVFVAEADEVKTVSVMEGDSVSLNSGLTETQEIILILWRFGESGSAIAQINRKDISYPSHIDVFRGKLLLDQTGSLTINNMRTKHSGLYKLEINLKSGSPPRMTFNVTVSESPSVDVGEVEMKSVSVLEGNSVTLQTDVTETNGGELIVWRFGDEGKLIAKYDVVKSSPLLDTDERFRDRLQLDHQTGSLTITHTRTTDSGFYTMKISSNKQTLYKRFSVAVSDPGLSSGAVAGIVIVVLLLFAAAAAAGVIYHRRKISELQRQLLKTVSLFEGDSVTLNTDVPEIHRDDLIEWRFGDRGSLIAEISGGVTEIYDSGLDERFIDRLKLDKKTGSLTIMDTTNTHSGLYELKISQDSKITYKKFNVSICVGSLSMFEGVPVTLQTDVTEIQRDDLIKWRFGDKGPLIAEIREGEIVKYDDGRFGGRLELDKKTGSLTITHTTTKHAGDYRLQITSNRGVSYKTFRVDLRKRKILASEGKNVIINPETEIQKDDQIQWRFRDILIAEISGGTLKTHDDADDGRFRGRLKLDEKTGSLIITDMITKLTGHYQLQIISRRGNTNKRFFVTVCPRNISADEGDSVPLNPETEIQKDDQIQWRFGDILIAEIRGGTGNTRDVNGRFRGRLMLDEKTGTLNIAKMRIEHSGEYKLQIKSSRGTTNKRFKVNVACSAYTYKTVVEGRDVTLSSDTYIVKDEVKWLFNDEILASGKNGDINKTSYHGERLKNRLELDHETGSLTIKNIRTSDTGVYHLKFLTLGIERKFRVTVNERNIFKSEGEDETLNPDTEIQKDDQIVWSFENILIAEIRGGTLKTHDDAADGIFRGRLKLDEKTGSLTITDITTELTGVYQLQINSSRGNTNKAFFVTVRQSSRSITQDQPDPVYANDTPILQMQPDASGNRKNESVTVVMPLLRGENKQEGMSSL